MTRSRDRRNHAAILAAIRQKPMPLSGLSPGIRPSDAERATSPRVGRREITSLMKNIIGIILIALGIFLFVQGLNRKDSIAGAASEAGTELANAVDGGARQPKHVVYMVAGGVVALIGIGVIARKPRAV